MAARGDAVAQLVVVREKIREGFESADFGEMLFGGGHDGAEHEIEFPIAELRGDEDTRGKIRGVAEGFEAGGERAVGEAAIEAGDTADARIAEGCNHGAQEALLDADVAIADDEEIVARFTGHAAELRDLVACAHGLRADEQANWATGKIANDFFDHGDGGIGIVRHAEEDFELGVILAAEACVVVVSLAVEAVNGFQDADRRSEIGRVIGAGSEKAPSGENCEKVVGEGRGRQHEESIANCRPRRHEAILCPLSLADEHQHHADAHEQDRRTTAGA